MNMLLPDKFTPVTGAKVKVAVYDIRPLGEDYSVSPILLSVLRDLARGTDILIEHSSDVLNEVSLSDKRIEDALSLTDADLMVFGSYVATRSNVQPMIHIICTYGRPMEQSSGLPEGMNLGQAIEEGDAILQMPRHILLREILPVITFETLSFQNTLAEEIFDIAQFIQAIKLYKDKKFEETIQAVNAILNRTGEAEAWPNYWAPYNYLHMLGGLAYLQTGNPQAAVYTLSNVIARSSPAKMRVQRCAEEILSSLMESESQSQAADGQGSGGQESAGQKAASQAADAGAAPAEAAGAAPASVTETAEAKTAGGETEKPAGKPATA